MQKKIINYKIKGVTLIELIISISIISVVLIAILNIQIFGNKTFNNGSSKADIQSSLRLSAGYISNKIRYASNVKILSSIPAFDPSYEYIYSEDGILKHYINGTIENIIGNQPGVSSTLYFADANTETVNFKITGTQKNETYNIDTSVYMLNVGTGGLPECNGTVIQFTEGVPVNANVNAKPVESITLNTMPDGVDKVNKSGTLQFSATVLPTDASINTVTWYVDEASLSYATIASTGPQSGILTVTNAPINNQIKVYAEAIDGSGVVSSPYLVTVSDLTDISVTSVTVSSGFDNPIPDYIFKQSGRVQMYANISPSNATNQNVYWSIDCNNSIATIDSSGVLTTNSFNNSALSEIEVKATSISDPSKYGTKIIKIIPNVDNKTKFNIESVYNINDNTYTISCYFKDTNNLVNYANGIKSIKYYINKSGTEIKVDNPFYVSLGKNDKINIILTPLTGNDIIITYKP